MASERTRYEIVRWAWPWMSLRSGFGRQHLLVRWRSGMIWPACGTKVHGWSDADGDGTTETCRSCKRAETKLLAAHIPHTPTGGPEGGHDA